MIWIAGGARAKWLAQAPLLRYDRTSAKWRLGLLWEGEIVFLILPSQNGKCRVYRKREDIPRKSLYTWATAERVLSSGGSLDSWSAPTRGQHLRDKFILSCHGYMHKPQVIQVYWRLNFSVL